MNIVRRNMWNSYTLLGGALTSVYAAYRLGTYRETRVWVKEKHMIGHGLPCYGFVSSDHQKYRIPYSLLSWQLRPKTIWDGIQPGAIYAIRYWGIPELGLCVDRIRLIQEGTEEDVAFVQEL